MAKDNRSILIVTGFLLSIGYAASVAAGETTTFSKKSYSYKSVDGLDLQADVYRSEDTQIRPAVVWIHGGALIMGSRAGVPSRLVEICKTDGLVLVSVDYRLAPEVKAPAIIDDIKDFFRWLHRDGRRLLHIDDKKIVVTGESAGGYLTIMTGICVEPKPTALVAYWGYGDVDGDWYVKPSEHYRKIPLVKETTARGAVGSRVLPGSGVRGPERNRYLYYLYLRQNGLWTKEVTGFDPVADRQKLDPYCPVRNITPNYPPILMVHGTVDTDVPYDKSAEMAAELAKHKVTYELVTVPGAGHGLSGGDKAQNAAAHAKAIEFIRKYTK
jgi:acetyl esterase/lipase